MDGREGGFIKLHRRILSSPDLTGFRGEHFAVFVQILFLANWKPGHFWVGPHRVDIDRGELAHSLQQIAREANASVRVVRTTIDNLLARGVLTVRNDTPAATRVRVLRIVNYRKYQDVPSDGDTASDTTPTQGRHDADTTPTPIEEGEEGKKGTFSLLPDENPPAIASGKVRHLSAQQEAFDYWKANIWPRISPATCPEPGKGVFVRLASLCKTHGLAEVKEAMERAASLIATDAWVRDNLTLQHFVADANFAKYLPRGVRQPSPKVRILTAD